ESWPRVVTSKIGALLGDGHALQLDRPPACFLHVARTAHRDRSRGSHPKSPSRGLHARAPSCRPELGQDNIDTTRTSLAILLSDKLCYGLRTPEDQFSRVTFCLFSGSNRGDAQCFPL